MLDGTQIDEAFLEEGVPLDAGYLLDLIDVWKIRRFRARDDIESDVWILLREFDDPSPSEEVLPALWHIGEDVVPLRDGLRFVDLGRDAPDEADVHPRQLLRLVLEGRRIRDMDVGRRERIGEALSHEALMLEDVRPNPLGDEPELRVIPLLLRHPVEDRLEIAHIPYPIGPGEIMGLKAVLLPLPEDGLQSPLLGIADALYFVTEVAAVAWGTCGDDCEPHVN